MYRPLSLCVQAPVAVCTEPCRCVYRPLSLCVQNPFAVCTEPCRCVYRPLSLCVQNPVAVCTEPCRCVYRYRDVRTSGADPRGPQTVPGPQGHGHHAGHQAQAGGAHQERERDPGLCLPPLHRQYVSVLASVSHPFIVNM